MLYRFSFCAFLLCSLAYYTCAQSVIRDVDRLISQRKYLSAIQLLNDEDPKNKSVELTLKKLEICLEYFAQSINHKIFFFRDLQPGEDLMEVRRAGNGDSFQSGAMEIEKALEKLSEKYPKDVKLYDGLVIFFYDVSFRYSKWVEGTGNPMDYVIQYGEKSVKLNTNNCKTLHAYGTALLYRNSHLNAIDHLEKAASLCDTFANAHYNLAFAYVQANQKEKALIQAKRSLSLYDTKREPGFKADAARMIAVTYQELRDNDSSEKYFELSQYIQPYEARTCFELLQHYLLTNRIEKLSGYRDSVFDYYKSKDFVGNRVILSVYIKHKRVDEVVTFFENRLSVDKEENAAAGLHLALGVCYKEQGDKRKARAFLEKAEAMYKAIFADSKHPVFGMIEQLKHDL